MNNNRNTLYNNESYGSMNVVGNSSLPKRHFTKGARKLVGFRLPDELKKKIESLANELGWTVTDVAQTALDQYVHSELPKVKEHNPRSGS